MKKKIGIMAACLLMVAMAFQVEAAVITFDDIPNSYDTAIPAGYQGFTWDTNFYVLTQAGFQSDYGNTYTFPSYPNAAFNAAGVNTVTLSSGSAFNFNGAYFSSLALDNGPWSYGSSSLTVTGYNGATLIGSVNFSLPYDGFDWVSANFMGVTSLVFTNNASGTWWLMDNFTYNATAPEPCTMLLLGSGLLGLVALRKKFRA